MTRPHFYILDGHTPVPVEGDDVHGWAQHSGGPEQRFDTDTNTWGDTWRVDRTDIDDDTYVSTVFLGLDHQWHADGPPQLFETMVFHGGHADDEDYQERCSTWDEAVQMHARAVEWARRPR